MGISGISIPQLLIILTIILLLFGTKKLSSLGTDLGSAIKGFRKAISPNDETESAKTEQSKEEEEKANTVS